MEKIIITSYAFIINDRSSQLGCSLNGFGSNKAFKVSFSMTCCENLRYAHYYLVKNTRHVMFLGLMTKNVDHRFVPAKRTMTRMNE